MRDLEPDEQTSVRTDALPAVNSDIRACGVRVLGRHDDLDRAPVFAGALPLHESRLLHAVARTSLSYH